jgi:hypothetical protein
VKNTAYATDGKIQSPPDDETVTFTNLPPVIICPIPVITQCSQVVSGLAATISDPNNNIASLAWTMTGATISSGTGNIMPDPYTFAWGTTTVTYILTDASGASASCSFVVDVNQCGTVSLCTYTQGFYGSQNGKACDLEVSMRGDIFVTNLLINGGDLIIGGPENYVKFLGTDPVKSANSAALIRDILPGGGGASMLTQKCDPVSKSCLSLSKQGRLNNGLLAQTITLGLNLRINEGLSSLPLEEGWLTTQKRQDCSEGSGVVNPVCIDGSITVNPFRYYKIPEVVLCYLETTLDDKGFPKYGLTVEGLFKLANNALGGLIPYTVRTYPMCGGKPLKLTDILSAVDMINNAFDECRVFVGYREKKFECPPQVTATAASRTKLDEVSLVVYPNPFETSTRFELTMNRDSHIRLEIFNNAGMPIEVILDEDLKQGDVRTVEFDASRYLHTMFMYRVTANGKIESGTIMKTK